MKVCCYEFLITSMYDDCQIYQINIAYPSAGNQKFIDIDDEKRL